MPVITTNPIETTTPLRYSRALLATRWWVAEKNALPDPKLSVGRIAPWMKQNPDVDYIIIDLEHIIPYIAAGSTKHIASYCEYLGILDNALHGDKKLIVYGLPNYNPWRGRGPDGEKEPIEVFYKRQTQEWMNCLEVLDCAGGFAPVYYFRCPYFNYYRDTIDIWIDRQLEFIGKQGIARDCYPMMNHLVWNNTHSDWHGQLIDIKSATVRCQNLRRAGVENVFYWFNEEQYNEAFHRTLIDHFEPQREPSISFREAWGWWCRELENKAPDKLQHSVDLMIRDYHGRTKS
jgi:hypothetical protein